MDLICQHHAICISNFRWSNWNLTVMNFFTLGIMGIGKIATFGMVFKWNGNG